MREVVGERGQADATAKVCPFNKVGPEIKRGRFRWGVSVVSCHIPMTWGMD